MWFLLCFSFVLANPVRNSLTFDQSVSDNPEARSIFSNPAALGYETILNGGGVYSSLGYARNDAKDSEFLGALSFGNLGFGYESLFPNAERIHKYHFAAGISLSPSLYLGERITLARPTISEGFTSLGLGLQFRPIPYGAIGIFCDQIARDPVLCGAGIVVEPNPLLRLSFDLFSTQSSFFTQMGYLGRLELFAFPGISAFTSYHSDTQFQVGASFAIDRWQLSSMAQPSDPNRRWRATLDTAILPRGSALSIPNTLELKTTAALSEEGNPGGWFSETEPSLIELLKEIETAGKQKYQKLILKIDSFPLGLAAAADLHAALSQTRKHGTQIEVFLSNASLKEFLIASAANTIHLEPAGSIAILGVKSEKYFFKGPLTKLGIEGQFLEKGKFKSAPETFTREKSSPESQEVTESLLKEAESILPKLIGQHRPQLVAKWKEVLEKGIFSAIEAQKLGLIDSIDTYDVTLKKWEGQFHIVHSTATHKKDLSLPPQLAIIPASGDILNSQGSLHRFSSRGAITPRKMEKMLKSAVSNPRVSAILLRVSSGGGDVLASDQIAATIKHYGEKKPIWVSMGDAAASGGYYISAPAQKITASPLTATGSIGIFFGKFNLSGMYQWLHLKKEVTSSSPFASLFSEHRAWNEKEVSTLKNRLQIFYDQFLQHVATHRHLKIESVKSAAEGRVWMGTQALGLKLVDSVEDYLSTSQQLAQSRGLPDNYEIAVIQSPNESLFSGLFPSLEIHSALAKELFWASHLSETPFLYLSPYDLQ